MKQLAKAQLNSNIFCGVALGVIYDRSWPVYYRRDLQAKGLSVYTATTPKLPGTLSFLWQYLNKGMIEKWIQDFAHEMRANTVILHCHNAWMSGVFVPVSKYTDINIIFISTFHGVPARFQRKPIRHLLHIWMAKRLIKYKCQLTSVDSFNPDIAKKLFHIPKANFAVIPNGLAYKKQPRDRYPYHRHFLRVGFIGNMAEGKGWRIAIEAVIRINQSGRKVKITLAGKGVDEKMVSNWAERYSEFVEYLGYVQNPLKTLMPDLDVLAVMSDKEGLPMTIIEGMAAAVPVVATPVGGIPMAVEHEGTGYLIPRTVEAMTNVLCMLFDDPKILQTMSKRAHEVFDQKFQIDRIAKQYAEVYGLKDVA
jgi:glycosyltransferase involved in cell wall biosynthesis